MEIISIKKAKLTSKNTVETTFIDGHGNEVTFKSESVAPPSLIESFGRLVRYLADYTEQKEATLIETFEEEYGQHEKDAFSMLSVNGIAFGSGSNGRNVTMSGSRRLANGSVMNFSTPKIDLDPTTNPWALLVPFERAVERVVGEVMEFIAQDQLRQANDILAAKLDKMEVESVSVVLPDAPEDVVFTNDRD